MFKHILVPTDGSPLSGQAVDKAIAFGRAIGARITFFTAMAEPPFPVTSYGEDGRYDTDKVKRFVETARLHAQGIVDGAVAKARDAGVAAEPLLDTDDAPWQAIIRAAEGHGCDLIFMASHGRRGVEALLLGSETHKVLTYCKIPVLVCR